MQEALELVPANAHPMDVMRTGCSVLGTVLPEREGHPASEARDIADKLIASFGSMLLYWWHFTRNGRRIDVRDRRRHRRRALPAPAARRRRRAQLHADALDKSLILYAEHEFNASHLHRARDRRHRFGHAFVHHRRDRRAARPEARRRERSGDGHHQPLRAADEAEADIRARVERKEIVIGFGHPVYTIGDPRNPIIKEISRKLCAEGGNQVLFDVSERIETLMWDTEEDVPEPRLVQRVGLPHDGHPDADVHAAVRHRAHHRLVART